MVTRITKPKRPQKRERPSHRRKREELASTITSKSSDVIPDSVHQQPSEPGSVENCYTHARLEGPRDIRVMALHPTSGDELRFDLKVISLDDPIKYRAVSYAWGEQLDDGSHLSHIIWCGDRALAVTEHLHCGLRRIREYGQSLRGNGSTRFMLCVDAICINQADHSERGRQVRIMDRIFMRASSTIVCLGEEIYDGEFAQLEEVCRERDRINAFKGKHVRVQTVLKRLFGRKWFERRWTLQEYILSSRVVFLVESVSLLPAQLVKIAERYSVHPSQIPVLLRQQEDEESGSPRSLVNNLVRFSSHHCTDPSDYVYALLGISRDGHKFTVDYTKHFSEIFVQVSKQYLDQSQASCSGLQPNVQVSYADTLYRLSDLLMAAVMSRNRRPEPPEVSLPSWVANWRFPIPTDSIDILKVFGWRYPRSMENADLLHLYVQSVFTEVHGLSLILGGLIILPSEFNAFFKAKSEAAKETSVLHDEIQSRWKHFCENHDEISRSASESERRREVLFTLMMNTRPPHSEWGSPEWILSEQERLSWVPGLDFCYRSVPQHHLPLPNPKCFLHVLQHIMHQAPM